jgi:hypothetical protein
MLLGIMTLFFVDAGAAASALRTRGMDAALHEDSDTKSKPKTFFWDNASSLDDKQFKSFFRVTKAVFNSIVQKISASSIFLTPANVGSRALTVDRQLGVFLLRGGGQTCSVIASLMDVSLSSVVTATERVCQAIIECYPHAINLAPEGQEKERQLNAFAEKGFPGGRCIVDVCKMKVTVETDVARAGRRHEFIDRHTQVVQSYQYAVDSEYRILHVCGGQGGPMSDQTIFYQSPLYTRLAALLRKGEYYLGDKGYALREYIVSGFRKNEISAAPLSIAQAMSFFNRRFSGTRNIVERVFGILKARFPLLAEGSEWRARVACVAGH